MPRPRPRLPVLLLGKHMTALGVLRTLARDGVDVLGAEETQDVFTRSRFYRAAERRLPETAEGEALGRFLEGLRLPAAVLIACSDRWTQAVAALAPELRERFPASVSTRNTIDQFVDKSHFRALVQRLGIPAPRSVPIEGPDDLDPLPDAELEGAFLKPSDSQTFARRFGLKGAFVSSRDAAKRLIAAGVAAGTTFELQEWIPGEASETILLDGFVDHSGRFAAMSARRRLRMDPPKLANTCCDVMIPMEDAGEAPADVRRLLAAVNYRGVFNVEFKHDHRDGQFKIIEVNARPFWLIGHVASAGLDLPWLSYLDAQELPLPEASAYEVGRYGLYEVPDAAAIVRAVIHGRRPNGPVLAPWLRGDHSAFWPSDPLPGVLDVLAAVRRRISRERPAGADYLIASGLTGDPTAPVITSGGALKRNS